MDDTELLVGDALESAQYRVYPDTPLGEVVDLMVRRRIRAVPVVGEQYEVLGIITVGDALDHVLRSGPGDHVDGDEAVLARDVMTRSVLCVSEDQRLVEAAQMMVHRRVDQLPVVQEGELRGFVTRDSILRALRGSDPSEESGTQE